MGSRVESLSFRELTLCMGAGDSSAPGSLLRNAEPSASHAHIPVPPGTCASSLTHDVCPSASCCTGVQCANAKGF
jgi:hypothetical protein